ncbi:MAG: hypothetical protein ACRDRH_20080 [Pseudonocardia sp.]
MPAPRKYPSELCERVQWTVAEAMAEDPSLLLNAVVNRIGPWVGVVPDMLRGWVKQSRIDTGAAPGIMTGDAVEVTELRAEVRELRRANEILVVASSFVARVLDPRLRW